MSLLILSCRSYKRDCYDNFHPSTLRTGIMSPYSRSKDITQDAPSIAGRASSWYSWLGDSLSSFSSVPTEILGFIPRASSPALGTGESLRPQPSTRIAQTEPNETPRPLQPLPPQINVFNVISPPRPIGPMRYPSRSHVRSRHFTPIKHDSPHMNGECNENCWCRDLWTEVEHDPRLDRYMPQEEVPLLSRRQQQGFRYDDPASQVLHRPSNAYRRPD